MSVQSCYWRVRFIKVICILAIVCERRVSKETLSKEQGFLLVASARVHARFPPIPVGLGYLPHTVPHGHANADDNDRLNADLLHRPRTWRSVNRDPCQTYLGRLRTANVTFTALRRWNSEHQKAVACVLR